MNTFKRKAISAAILGGLLVSGCSLFGDKKAEDTTAPQAGRVEVVQATPTCSFTAAPGQTLKIEGLAKFECYGNQSGPQIVQAQQAAPHPAWSILATGLNVLGNVAGIKYAGDNTVNLVRAIGGITAGFSVPAPQPNISVGSGATVSFGGAATGANSGASSGNSGRIGNDDNSQRPVNTINCATGPGGAAAAGGNGAGTTNGGAGGVGGAGAPSGSVNCAAGK